MNMEGRSRGDPLQHSTERKVSWQPDIDAINGTHNHEHVICEGVVGHLCLCEHGANFHDRSDQWAMMLCSGCGNAGKHVKCGGFEELPDDDWFCSACFKGGSVSSNNIHLSKCSSNICLCLGGSGQRSFHSETGDWQIVSCDGDHCKSGTHVKCAGLKAVEEKWLCKECSTPPSDIQESVSASASSLPLVMNDGHRRITNTGSCKLSCKKCKGHDTFKQTGSCKSSCKKCKGHDTLEKNCKKCKQSCKVCNEKKKKRKKKKIVKQKKKEKKDKDELQEMVEEEEEVIIVSDDVDDVNEDPQVAQLKKEHARLQKENKEQKDAVDSIVKVKSELDNIVSNYYNKVAATNIEIKEFKKFEVAINIPPEYNGMNSQWEDWAECYILKEFTERQYNAHGKAGVSVMTSYDVVLTNPKKHYKILRKANRVRELHDTNAIVLPSEDGTGAIVLDGAKNDSTSSSSSSSSSSSLVLLSSPSSLSSSLVPLLPPMSSVAIGHNTFVASIKALGSALDDCDIDDYHSKQRLWNTLIDVGWKRLRNVDSGSWIYMAPTVANINEGDFGMNMFKNLIDLVESLRRRKEDFQLSTMKKRKREKQTTQEKDEPIQSSASSSSSSLASSSLPCTPPSSLVLSVATPPSLPAVSSSKRKREEEEEKGVNEIIKKKKRKKKKKKKKKKKNDFENVTIEDLELPHPENWVLEEGGDSVSRLCFQGKIGEEEY